MSDSATPRCPAEKDIFFAALDLAPGTERDRFLDGACGGDPAFRARVEGLLDGCHPSDDFMQTPAVKGGPDVSPRREASWSPDLGGLARRLGRYRLLEKIGEGGFGEVWMADQLEPVRRRVAVKLIKPGMDSKQVVARFEAERQALALMDHPNIARIFDAGTSESAGFPHAILDPQFDRGRPYFVMELVRGTWITDYCDRHAVGIAERLRLFIQVCQAIQHAHQKGILHRDIKPSNVLVTLRDGVPVPKVIDFGIAKALQQPLTDRTVFTEFQQFLGTPAYVSPEQVGLGGLDVDTRSDIYSLGVLLYELLVGRTPLDAREMMKDGYDGLRACIREREPLKPSTRLGSLPPADRGEVARCRGTEFAKLVEGMRGDLDWIAVKCLEKDRSRRYDTANGLAMDLERHLGSEPVIARPPSVAYQVQKFWLRHRLAVTAALVVLVALLVATGVSLSQAIRATRAERVARQQFEVASAERDAKARAEVALRARNLDLRQAAYRVGILQVVAAEESRDHDAARIALDACEPELRGWEWFWLDSRVPLAKRIPLRNRRTGAGAAFLTSDGARLSSVWRDGAQRFLSTIDLATGEVLREVALPTNFLTAAMDPAGTHAALGLLGGGMAMLDSGTGRLQPAEPSLPEHIRFLALDPTGRRVAGLSAEGTTTLWDSSTGRSLATNRVADRLTSLAFSPDGRWLLVGGATNGIRLLEANHLSSVAGAGLGVTGHVVVAFSPAGTQFVTGSADGRVQVWRLAGLRPEFQCERLHVGQVQDGAKTVRVSSVSAVDWSPDGSRLVSAGQDKVIRVWSASDGRLLDTFPSRMEGAAWVPSLRFSADGRFVLAAGGTTDAAARLWRLDHDAPPATIAAHSGRLWALAFTPDSQRLVTAGWDGRLRTWRARDGLLLGTGTGHADRTLWSLSISRDGTRAVTASQDGTLRIWDLPAGEPVGAAWVAEPPDASRPNNRTLYAAISPDGRRVASGSFRGNLLLWDVATGRRLWSPPEAAACVWSIAWSPDGHRVALGQTVGRLTMLDTRQERELWRQSSPGGPSTIVQGLSFSPDGRTVASAGWSGELCIWDADDGRLLHMVDVSTRPLRAVTHSPDGRRIATGGDDGIVRIFNTHGAAQILALPPEAGEVFSLAFSPDGQSLAVGEAMGKVRIWKAGASATFDRARAVQ